MKPTVINKKTRKIILGAQEPQAGQLLKMILSNQKVNLAELSVLGRELMERGQFDFAARIFARWAELDPKNPVPWSNLGGSLAKLNLFGEAKKILEHAIELNPTYAGARINLCGVYQDTGEYKLALEAALNAVQCDPKSSLAFNNLGTALQDLGMFDEARHAFETSLLLSKDSFYARFNLAKIEAERGNIALAITHFEASLKEENRDRGANIDLIKYCLGFEYLKTGRISDGWDFYDCGFSEKIPRVIARHPMRTFRVPKWNGKKLKDGQRLLVWREQGVGDEVMFGSCLKLLEQIETDIILEVDKRLIRAMQRSFPCFEVREQKFSNSEGLVQTQFDYDFHIPLGSLPALFLKGIEDTSRLQPYIEPDKDLEDLFLRRLDKYRNLRKVGICWRSGLLNTRRNADYTLLDDWAGVFAMPNTVFVNLQYGDCEAELIEAEKKHNVEIIRWNDVDLKNDLDSVFAIMSNLDAFISVGTAVVPFAGAVGLKGVVMLLDDWVSLGSKEVYPWFPNIRSIVLPRTEYVAKALPLVPDVFEQLMSETCTV